MTETKGERLEVRLPTDMLDQLRQIAPMDNKGKPNLSALVRLALRREIRRHEMDDMVIWAQHNHDSLRIAQGDLDGVTGDGFSVR